jgi:hypothetical protein
MTEAEIVTMIKWFKTLSNDVVEAKGASAKDRQQALGAVRACDKILTYIKINNDEQEQINQRKKEMG